MTTTPTALLGLALPETGDLSGTWGTTVNNSITSLLDSAVAGTTTLSSNLDVTLSATDLAVNEARQAILLCTGTRTAIRTITAPARSKTYVVINATTGGFGVKVVGAGPTTGVTINNGEKAIIAWNGSDFVVVATSVIDLASEVSGTLPAGNGGTSNAFFAVTGPTTSVKTFTFPDAAATVLTNAAAVTILQGGTGQTTQGAAMTALAGSALSGRYLRGNGTNVIMDTIKAGDLPSLSSTYLSLADGGTVSNSVTIIGNNYLSTPKLALDTGAGTPSNGIYMPTTNTISLHTGVYGETMRWNANGNITTPANTAFTVNLATSQVNVIGSTGALTRVRYANITKNRGGAYTAGTDWQFTAPVTGVYFFSASATITGLGATDQFFVRLALVTTSATYTLWKIQPDSFSLEGYYQAGGSIAVPMTAGDTAYVGVAAALSFTNTGTIAAGDGTYFTGYLVG